MNKPKEEELSFELSFARREEILERMNSGKATLDESLKLYEEADRLIHNCTGRLNSAEQRIEQLIKNRNGELQLDLSGKPLTEEFQPQD